MFWYYVAVLVILTLGCLAAASCQRAIMECPRSHTVSMVHLRSDVLIRIGGEKCRTYNFKILDI